MVSEQRWPQPPSCHHNEKHRSTWVCDLPYMDTPCLPLAFNRTHIANTCAKISNPASSIICHEWTGSLMVSDLYEVCHLYCQYNYPQAVKMDFKNLSRPAVKYAAWIRGGLGSQPNTAVLSPLVMWEFQCTKSLCFPQAYVVCCGFHLRSWL